MVELMENVNYLNILKKMVLNNLHFGFFFFFDKNLIKTARHFLLTLIFLFLFFLNIFIYLNFFFFL